MPALRPALSLAAALLACAPASPSPAPPPGTEATPTPEAAPEGAPAREDALVLPSRFEADRVFLELRTEQGHPLRLFTDTGGGLYLLHHAVERLGLPVDRAPGDDGQPVEVVALPPLDATTPMPPLVVLDGRLPVAHEDPFGGAFGDGLLGQAWFRDRVWTFDYRDQALVLHPGSIDCDDGSAVPLGFLEQDGRRVASYPRIQAEIDGTVHDLLFDTGATVLLTEPGLRGLADDGPVARATSFIVRSVFDRWRAAHPDWRVIEHADRMAGDPMIEVPAVTIGELSVGPVWFTARADPNFHDFMSRFMDRTVDGALGGSALRYLRVTVDYPRARACLRAG
ncbi:MAG: hypothetical protein KDK70_33770 [Myxococcales bacterium]|nr:hypothetical protein [Myxococcales bacterium]